MKKLILFGALAAIALVISAGSASAASDDVRIKQDVGDDEVTDIEQWTHDVSVPEDGDPEVLDVPDITPIDPVETEDDDDVEEELTDSDGDMVPDEDDECVDVSGSALNFRCPIEGEEELESLEELAGAIDDLSGNGAGMEFVGSCSMLHGAAVDAAGLLAIALGLVPMALGRGRKRR